MNEKLKVGKFYKTRDGEKVEVIRTDLPPSWEGHTAIAIIYGSQGTWEAITYKKNGGRDYADVESKNDIVSEWIESNSVDEMTKKQRQQFVLDNLHLVPIDEVKKILCLEHKWREYRGLAESYSYCEICDVRREMTK